MWIPFPSELSPFHPFYHTVSDEKLPHIRHLYNVKTVATFETELDFLLKHFDPTEPLKISEIRGRKPPMLLSFDDGLQECYSIIAPILERKGIPAIFLVNSAFIDNKALFYRFKVSLLIEHLFKAKITPKAFLKWGSSRAQISRALLQITYDQASQIDSCAIEVGVDFEAFLHSQQPYLTLNQMHDLSRRGFIIGAHSHSHPHFYSLNNQRRQEEIALSTNFVRENFPNQPLYFSFPFTDFGIGEDFLQSLHHQFGITQSFGCAGLKKDKTATHFQRFAMEIGPPSVTFRLQRAIAAYHLKKTLGKHLINRAAWR